MRQTRANSHNRDADKESNTIEERLRLVIDTIPAIVWRKLPDGSADFFNRNFREYTGLSPIGNVSLFVSQGHGANDIDES